MIDDDADEYAAYMREVEPVTQTWRQRRDIAVKTALEAQKRAEEHEEAAKVERATYRRATEIMLPELLEEVGETKSETVDGIPLTLSTGYADISLAADKNPKRAEALQWLDDNQHGDVVKNLVVVELGPNSAEQAAAIVALVREHFPDALVKRARDAHTGTVTALANELFRTKKEFPIKLFNGRERKVVKIGNPKVK